MNKSYKFLAILGLASSAMIAQQIIPCYTDEAMKHLFEKDPAAKARYEQSQNEIPGPTILQRLAGNSQVASAYALDTIPIVFHILHTGGPENINDAVVYRSEERRVGKECRL